MHTGNSCNSPTGTPEAAPRRPAPDSRDRHRSDCSSDPGSSDSRRGPRSPGRSSGRNSDRVHLGRVQLWQPSVPSRATPKSSGFAYQPPSNPPSVLRAKVPLVSGQVPCQSAGLEVPWFHVVGRMAVIHQLGQHPNWWCFPFKVVTFSRFRQSHWVDSGGRGSVEVSHACMAP